MFIVDDGLLFYWTGYNLNLILCQYDIRLEIICTGTSETPTQICLHVFFCWYILITSYLLGRIQSCNSQTAQKN